MLAREIKEKLSQGEASIGTWMSMAHPSIAEILSMVPLMYSYSSSHPQAQKRNSKFPV
mgnify:CR=1 FL=1